MSGFNIATTKVLIVEDNLHFRTLIRTILQALGVESVEEARDGAEALDVLTSYDADLAIIDWKMDGLDGLECVRRIRAGEEGSNRYLPIIMVTGYTEDSLAREALDVGVNDFLSKPISAKSLMSRIISVLETAQDFVEVDSYFGPERRRLQTDFKGEERRADIPEVIEKEG